MRSLRRVWNQGVRNAQPAETACAIKPGPDGGCAVFEAPLETRETLSDNVFGRINPLGGQTIQFLKDLVAHSGGRDQGRTRAHDVTGAVTRRNHVLRRLVENVGFLRQVE